jgi:iron transport multicopper oxidase
MFITFVFLLSFLSAALAGTVTYDWSVDWVTAAPDGFSRQVIGINGQWPCPPIEATVGDTIVVNLYNNLGDESTGLHFHGLNQRGTQVMDGPSGVTQCPIPPGSHFTYTFQVSPASETSQVYGLTRPLPRSTNLVRTGTTVTTKDNTQMA